VEIEVLFDSDVESYIINLKGSRSGKAKKVIIPEANLKDRSKMLRFIMKYAKMAYDTI